MFIFAWLIKPTSEAKLQILRLCSSYQFCVISIFCNYLFSSRTPVKGRKMALKDCDESWRLPGVVSEHARVENHIFFLRPILLGQFNVQNFEL